MRRAPWLLLLCLLALFLWALPRSAQAEQPTLRGRVVDAEGRGVPAIEIATAWTVSTTEARPLRGVRTDAEGRFSLPIPRTGSAIAVVAYDASRARGAFVAVDPSSFGKELSLPLAPTVRATGDLTSSEGKFYPAGGVCFVALAASRNFAIRLEPTKGTYAVPLPPGAYRLEAMAPGREPGSIEFAVVGGKPTLALGTLDLKDRDTGALRGELAAPLRVKESHPVLDAALVAGHFPDRWTLFYFWDVT